RTVPSRSADRELTAVGLAQPRNDPRLHRRRWDRGRLAASTMPGPQAGRRLPRVRSRVRAALDADRERRPKPEEPARSWAAGRGGLLLGRGLLHVVARPEDSPCD